MLCAIFAIVMGVVLFVLDWIGIIPDEGKWWVYLIIGFVAILYIFLMYLVVKEPLTKLTPLTKEEEAQLDIDRIGVDTPSPHHKNLDWIY